MFRYVNIKNYKSLSNLKVDFSKTKSSIKNMVAIYGENGIGKSNLMEVFNTLHETLRTMSIKESLKKILENPRYDGNINDLDRILKLQFKDLETIIKSCKTINSRDNLVLEFGFAFENKNGVYRIETNNTEIVYESLDYVLHHNIVNFFTVSKDYVKINDGIFSDNLYFKEIYDLTSKYWGKHTLLSILNYEVEDKKLEYIKTKFNKSLYDVLYFFNSVSIRLKGGNKSEFLRLGTSHELFGKLENGKLPLSALEELNKTEQILNMFFSSLYSDVLEVYYKRESGIDEINYQLYMKKKIDRSNTIDIEFTYESTGTQNLLDLVPFFVSAIEGNVVMIDEIDTGIHDLLIEKILVKMKKYIKGQLIFTTHNTRLLESQLPNNMMYLLRYNNGIKELIVFDFYERIQKNINLRKRYLSGYYNDDDIRYKDLYFEELLYFISNNKY